MRTTRCVECHELPGGHSVLVCTDCGGIFHYPDARVNEVGPVCGTHEIGFRDLLGRDVTPLCMRCDVAFRLKFGIPA